MTTYMEVYRRFLRKIGDVKIANLPDETIEEYCFDVFTSAVDRLLLDSIGIEFDVEDRDDTTRLFNFDLKSYEIEIIALYMAAEWYSPQVDSLQHTSLFIGQKEEKFGNQKDHLNATAERQADLWAKAAKLVRNRGYKTVRDNYIGEQGGV